MSEGQDTATQKLQRGHKILTSGPNDSEILGLAFIRLHSALEDRLRELLAARLPRQRLEIYDLKNFTWKEILEYSRTHLGMSEADAAAIAQANACRNPVAHGGDFPWSREQVYQYERLITQLWATGARAGPPRPTLVDALRPSSPPARPGLFSAKAASRLAGAPSRSGPQAASWPRVKRLLWFFVLALLVSLSAVSAGFFLWEHLELVRYFTNPTPTAAAAPAAPAPAAPTRTSAAPTPTPSPAPTTAPAVTETPPSGLQTGCQVVWVETPGSALDKMNRAMVWTAVVGPQVAGSGMEPGQFYRLVAEQNPFLAADGYVFLKDKTYLLPRCAAGAAEPQP